MSVSPSLARRFVVHASAALLAVGLVILPAADAHAAVFTVTKTTDTADGSCNSDCSVREAVIAANASAGPDSIVVPAGNYVLTRTGAPENDSLTGDLDLIGVDVTVTGAGPGATVIDAGGMGGLDERVFHVGAFDSIGNPSAAISDLTITGGWAIGSDPNNTGGGILADVGVSLTLNRVHLIDNYAAQSGAGLQTEPGTTVTIADGVVAENETTTFGFGAGILVDGGDLTVHRTLIHDNHAMDTGGGMSVQGAAAEVLVENTTFTGNSANNSGGGLHVGQGTVDVNNVTLTDNHADADANGFGDGGGFYQNTGTLAFRNTILSGNHDDSPSPGQPEDCFAAPTSQGHNLIGDTTACTLTPTTGDQIGANPMLGPLADNGGPTRTHALLPGSPAINSGDPAPPGSGGTSCPATDQRGAPRNCDIGAYELVQCSGVTVNRVGTAGGDTLTGTDGPDGILALGGDDTANGLAGNDALCMGAGNDTSDGGPGDDVGLGEAGNDTGRGGDGDDVLDGGDSDDVLSGGPGNDVVIGGPGNDTLDGEDGNDQLDGGDGNDILSGGSGNDALIAGPGNDMGVGIDGNDTFLGGEGSDKGNGGAGKDLLKGEKGKDRLTGGSGRDNLLGGGGKDKLNCGGGKNEVGKGGGGKDKSSKCEKGKA